MTHDCARSGWKFDAGHRVVSPDPGAVRTVDAGFTLECNRGAGEPCLLGESPHEMRDRFADPGTASLRRGLGDLILARPGSGPGAFHAPAGTA